MPRGGPGYNSGDRRAAPRVLAKTPYTDAVSFAVTEAIRCPAAIGFDHDFVVAGFRLWQAPGGP